MDNQELMYEKSNKLLLGLVTGLGYLHVVYFCCFLLTGLLPLILFNAVGAVFCFLAVNLSSLKQHLRIILQIAIIEFCLHSLLVITLIGPDYGFHHLLLFLTTLIIIRPYANFRNPFLCGICVCVFYFFLRLYAFFTTPLYPQFENVEYSDIFLFLHIILLMFIFFRFATSYLASSEMTNVILGETNKELQKLAGLDPLTKLVNRRELFRRIERLEELTPDPEHARYCLCIGDIDDFKKINDTYGHDIGDFVLKSLSEIFSLSVRSQDIVCRWGGEEFLIVLSNISYLDALTRFDRIRSNIEKKTFCHEQVSLHITMTFGAASSQDGMSFQDVVNLADNRLYAGKRQGKNQVVRN